MTLYIIKLVCNVLTHWDRESIILVVAEDIFIFFVLECFLFKVDLNFSAICP